MRIWGRTPDGVWHMVTDAGGDDTEVRIVNLIQVLKLSRNESPFFANFGIPAQQSVIQQLFPDIYVNQTQAKFAQYFASLLVSRISSNPPTYQISATTKTGDIVPMNVPQ